MASKVQPWHHVVADHLEMKMEERKIGIEGE